MKYIITFFCLISLNSCNISGTWNDNQIDPAIRVSIDRINSQIVRALKDNNPNVILAHSSDQLMAKMKNNISLFVKDASKAIPSDATLVKLDQFSLQNTSENQMTNIVSEKGEHGYKITFLALNKKTVATVSEFTHPYRTLLLLTVYGKYGNAWKLNILKIGVSKMIGKDAIDWYKEAKTDLEAGDTIDAANKFAIVSDLMKPGGEYWSYNKESEVNLWKEKLQSAINSRPFFPIKIAINNNSVSIFGTTPRIDQDGHHPLFLYVTAIPMTDTTSLSKECDSIHSIICRLHPLLLHNNTIILYSAFHEMPSSDKDASYNFIRKVK